MKDEVRHATVALVAALERGDAAAAAALYADDGKLLTPGADLISGRRDIEAYWREGIAVGLSSAEFRATEVRTVPDFVMEIGHFRLGFARQGTLPSCDAGKYLVLHRRQTNGSWERAVEVFNPDVPASARPVRIDCLGRDRI